jgi:hypothetical protein
VKFLFAKGKSGDKGLKKRNQAILDEKKKLSKSSKSQKEAPKPEKAREK